MANSYLSRTFSGSPTMTTFTVSFWIKRTGIGATQRIFSSQIDTNNSSTFYFSASDQLNIATTVSGATKCDIRPNRRFRDTSAWYHIVVQKNTTLATANDRVKIWVNGVEETDVTRSTTQVQNAEDFFLKTGSTHEIGRRPVNNDQNFDGYLSHVCIVQGSVVAPTSFGETDSTSGIWKFKSPSGVSFGTNGFHLKFENSGALGTDSSGNSQTWTVNGNLKQALDTPSNVYCTLNPLDTSRGLSNGNTTYAGASAGTVVKGTLAVTSGKYYAECKIVDASENMIGVLDIGQAPTTTYVGHSSVGWGIYTGDGNLYNNASSSSYSSAFSDNDIMGIALDMDNNKLYFSKNGVWQNSGVPTSGATGTGAISITSGLTMTFCGGRDGASDTASFNFGNGYFGTTAITSAGSNGNGSLFEYDVPSGFYALNTKNINTYG